MKRSSWGALLLAAALAGCGGSSDGDQSLAVDYGKLVSFGDSLSDVGSYRVSGIAALGGGKFTVNDGAIWVELLAAEINVDAPCAAQTGLNATEAYVGFPPAPVENHDGCYAYAQGGARVTNPIGPSNAALLALGDSSGALGALTDPVVNQIERHLAITGGSFAADDLVTVMAGGNDLFMNLAQVSATAQAGGDVAAASQAAVEAMGVAGAELAGYVKSLIIANGAAHVVVVNVPDVSLTPLGLSNDAATQGLIRTMAETFNAQLSSGLDGVDEVAYVDAFTVSQQQAAEPETFGLVNVTTPVCDEALSPFGALSCTENTLIEADDTMHYEYADDVHPTPYGYRLLARLVSVELLRKGWL